MTVETLEQRLQALEIDAPDAGRVSARVLARPTRRRVRIPRFATAFVAFVLVAALVAYFVPAADLAVADRAPWSAELLQWAGLVGASDRITAVNSTATSSGYRLTLTGAYADSTRTVLLMHAEPAIITAGDPPVITDQFARTYRFNGSSSNTLTGDIVMQFEPMAWPDSITGARITLRVAQLEAPPQAFVYGTWELTAALGVDAAQPMPTPAPGDLGPAHFRFTSASYTPATVELDVEVTGVSADDLSRIVPNGAKGQPALTIEVIDGDGQMIGGGFGGPSSIQVLVSRTKGATYVVRVSYYGYGSFDRVLKIPS